MSIGGSVKSKVNPLIPCLYAGILMMTAVGVFAEPKPALKDPAPLPEQTLEPQCVAVFCDNAILQQRIPLPVWGTSLPGAKVTVSFDGQTKAAEADRNGKWRIILDSMDAASLKTVNDCPEGKTMVITCGKDGEKAVKEIKNLVMGDVWICAGQSNMAGAIKTNRSVHYPTNTLDLATYPAMRQWRSMGDTNWIVCAPDTAPAFKKVAFFFGRRLQRDALVPIGLISAAVGGSSIESWLNQEPYTVGGNYTKLIKPFVGFGIRGAIWYQGESNENDKRGYQPKLMSLITGWRKVWEQGDFPFYFVQLPGIGKSPTDNPAMGDGRAEIRQAYVEALALKNTGLAVTIDVGTPGEHPPNKYDTGVRLARSVLQKVYGFEDVSACPLYTGHRGFDHFFGTACCSGTDFHYAYIDGDRIPVPPIGDLDRKPLPKHPYSGDNRIGRIAPDFDIQELDQLFLKRSLAFMEDHVQKNPGKPFFLYHPTNAVHLPSFASSKCRGTTEAGPHGDFIFEFDKVVGEIMDALERLGIADNTLLMVTSDNGPEVFSVFNMRRDYEHDGARPWRGFKRDNWEGGHRIPLIARWPEKIAAGRKTDQTVCLCDVMATCAALVGADLPQNAAEDSYNILPVLFGQQPEDQPIREYTLHQTISLALSIRKGPWKYLDHQGSGGNHYEEYKELRQYALLKSACLLPDRIPLAFEQKDQRILFTDLPKACPDKIANMAIIELTFDEPPVHKGCSKQSALHQGKEY